MNRQFKKAVEYIEEKKGLKFIREIHFSEKTYLYLATLPAKQNHMSQKYIIKLILPGYPFESESIISSQFKHKNIVRYDSSGDLDSEKYGAKGFIVTDFIDGLTLTKLIQKLNYVGKQISIGQAITITKEILLALDHIHNRQSTDHKDLDVVYKDVSPANVIVSREGEVKLFDFGISLTSNYQEQIQAGTELYMSPEAMAGKSCDRRADLYSVSILLASLLSMQKYRENTIETLIISGKIDSELYQILKKGTDKIPDNRYQSALEMIKFLDEYLHEKKILVYSYEIKKLVEEATKSDEKSTFVLKENEERLDGFFSKKSKSNIWKNPILLGIVVCTILLTIVIRFYEPNHNKTKDADAKLTENSEKNPTQDTQKIEKKDIETSNVVEKKLKAKDQKTDEKIVMQNPAIFYGQLYIGASPMATVSIKNQFSNKNAPFTVKLPTGEHLVTIKWEGTTPLTKKIKIERDKKIECRAMYALGLKSMSCK